VANEEAAAPGLWKIAISEVVAYFAIEADGADAGVYL